MTDVLGRVDFFRSEPDRDPRDGLKEWQHFVVHGDGARIIVNFSLSRGEWPTSRHVGRVIVLVHDESWSGSVTDVAIDDVVVERGRTTSARFGDNRIAFVDGAYVVELHLPRHRISARLRFVPVSTPFVKNNQPVGDGRMSWLFVPRLLADGHLIVGSTRFGMRRAVAYHDHNWGRFRWGQDFGWQWGTALPVSADDPWSIVFMRMTDRTHSWTRSQCLYVWKDGRPAAMFRDGTLEVTQHGLLRSGPSRTVPGALALVAPGRASDVPASMTLRARRGDDHLEVVIVPEEFARIAVPAETGASPLVALHEVSAVIRATGSVGSSTIDLEGSGVVEFLR